ncbi:hypothetical protein B0H14DRAFT_1138720 [Mycena olivaceomarginata]|nr:hypothetical protein B0H14DRAFT_1138720 [Mycena olivaceomarginata]
MFGDNLTECESMSVEEDDAMDDDEDEHPIFVDEEQASHPATLTKPIPIESVGPHRQPTIILNATNESAWCDELTVNSDVLRSVMSRWVRSFNVHFGWCTPESGEKNPDMRAVMQEMNTVPKALHDREDFRDLFHFSGLQLVFETLCDERGDSEFDPHLTVSYRLHDWRNQLNVLWYNWSPQEIYEGKEWEEIPTNILNPNSKDKRSYNFLQALGQKQGGIPHGTCPAQAVFFLAGRLSFLHAWEVWLRGSLLRDDAEIAAWNPLGLFRALAGTRCAEWSKQLTKRGIPYPPELELLLQLNEDLRDYIKLAREQARFPSATAAQKRKSKSMKKKDKEYMAPGQPEPQPIPAGSTGAGDLPPQFTRFEDNPAVRPRLHKGCASCCGMPDPDDRCVRVWYVDPRYETPDDLPPRVLSPRNTPHIVEKCKRDITLLVSSATQEQVGSASFGAIRDPLLQELQNIDFSVLHRRGDADSPYHHLKSDSEADIRLLFAHAKVAETIISRVDVMDSDAAKALRLDVGLDPLGSTQCNLHCCLDSSCRPRDYDGVKGQEANEETEPAEKLSHCDAGSAQLYDNGPAEEFNDVYVEWGVLLKTAPGCVWVFNHADMRRVVSRRGSVDKAGAECSGMHPTVTTANAARGRALKRARRLHRVTAAYWKRRSLENEPLAQ